MVEGRANTDDVFETLLRRAITESVIGGLGSRDARDEDLVRRLRHYERRARAQQLSSQTLQVITSARRLLGDRPGRGGIADGGSR